MSSTEYTTIRLPSVFVKNMIDKFVDPAVGLGSRAAVIKDAMRKYHLQREMKREGL